MFESKERFLKKRGKMAKVSKKKAWPGNRTIERENQALVGLRKGKAGKKAVQKEPTRKAHPWDQGSSKKIILKPLDVEGEFDDLDRKVKEFSDEKTIKLPEKDRLQKLMEKVDGRGGSRSEGIEGKLSPAEMMEQLKKIEEETETAEDERNRIIEEHRKRRKDAFWGEEESEEDE